MESAKRKHEASTESDFTERKEAIEEADAVVTKKAKLTEAGEASTDSGAGEDPTKWSMEVLESKLKDLDVSTEQDKLIEAILELIQNVDHLANSHIIEMLKKCPDAVQATVMSRANAQHVEELANDYYGLDEEDDDADKEKAKGDAPTYKSIDDLLDAEFDIVKEVFTEAIADHLSAHDEPIFDAVFDFAKIGEFPAELYQRLTWTGPYANSIALENEDDMDEEDEDFDAAEDVDEEEEDVDEEEQDDDNAGEQEEDDQGGDVEEDQEDEEEDDAGEGEDDAGEDDEEEPEDDDE